MCCFWQELIFQFVGLFDDGTGHRFFWRLSSEFSDQLPDHVQQVKRFRNLGGSLEILELTGNGGYALHVPPVEPVGESVPSFSCCLGGVHNLASDTCCKSLHRKVNVFELPIDILAELRQSTGPCPTLASVQLVST